MWEPAGFCCFSRRTGCLLIAAFHMVVSTAVVTLGVMAWVLSLSVFLAHVCGSSYGGFCVAFMSHLFNYPYIVVPVALLDLITSTLMVHGVLVDNSAFLVPFLIKATIVYMLHLISCALSLVMLFRGDWRHLMIYITFMTPCMFLVTYVLLTVRAHYHELLRNKKDDQANLIVNSTAVDVDQVDKV